MPLPNANVDFDEFINRRALAPVFQHLKKMINNELLNKKNSRSTLIKSTNQMIVSFFLSYCIKPKKQRPKSLIMHWSFIVESNPRDVRKNQ